MLQVSSFMYVFWFLCTQYYLWTARHVSYNIAAAALAGWLQKLQAKLWEPKNMCATEEQWRKLDIWFSG